MALTIRLDPHPLLDAGAFVARFSGPLGATPAPAALLALATGAAPPTPLTTSDAVRVAVRDLLRAGGFKPSGRSKPASEYLVAAVAAQRFPTINAGVDACNVVSLHAGLPISVVDLDRLEPPLSIRVAPAGTTYAFNPSAQVIDAGGLVCLYDAQGPTGTPVKDAQRTKTHDATRAVVVIIWGTVALPDRTREAARWYRELLATYAGATFEDVVLAR